MVKYPSMKPRHVCIYVMSECTTMPGTDTNVIPLIEAPIMPKATMYHGERRPAL